MSAITAIGVYTPQYRIPAEAFEGQFDAAGVSAAAVPGPDEDPLTMAQEAGATALAAADVDGETVDWLGAASSRPPVAEGEWGVHLGAMLGVPDGCAHQHFAGTTRAGTRAIAGALDALAGGADRALVVIADAPRGAPNDGIEHAAGAGAAAFVLEPSGPLSIEATAEHALAAPGTRFRQQGAEHTEGLGVTQYDRSVFLETLGGARDSLEWDGTPEAVAVQAPDGKLPYRAASLPGVETEAIQEAAVVHELGDLGAASVPLGVAAAVRAGGTTILGLSYGGGGGADALAFERTGTVPVAGSMDTSEELSYSDYLRYREEITGGQPEGGGAYVSVPTWQRSLPQRYRLVAGRCPACDELAFPPAGACPSCGTLESYDDVELPGTGTIAALTTISQGGAPPEFATYQEQVGDFPAAIVALDGPEESEQVTVPVMATDCEPADVTVGTSVETVIRYLYTQEGVTRYGFKVTPKD